MPENTVQPVSRAYIARVDSIDRARRSLVSKINTSAVDRFLTMIDPKGIDRSNYNNNKVVLWEHGQDPARGAMPIGRNSWIKPAIGPNGPELIAETHFYEKGKKGDEFTERLFECYADRDMSAFSVRVIPKGDCSPPTPDEIRARPELADCYMCYRSSELAEYSCVAVPGNQECLTLSEARSVLKLVERGLTLNPDLVSQAREITKQQYYLEHNGDKWRVVHAVDGIVSEHESKEEALLHKDQLEAGKCTVVAHGDNGDDNTTSSVQASLPPLGGRSFSDRRAELSGQVRAMFDVASIQQQIKDRADQARGRV